jgi:hypothetical protein
LVGSIFEAQKQSAMTRAPEQQACLIELCFSQFMAAADKLDRRRLI